VTMAGWDDVRRLALALPETSEDDRRGTPAWGVRGKGFAWERPLRRGDVAALGADAPDGPILCAYVPDLGVKEALLRAEPDVYFTTPHFDGFPAVLVRLDRIHVDELAEREVLPRRARLTVRAASPSRSRPRSRA
jgi:hypothetical protein